ncbi:hypothetical protein [Paenibacillus sp. Leaf72]|uniref:hypothetical protein n=1 Tax=Paenibacillus sp. Leaf72 TaxID=1736234 RepID=UPI000702186F|nr:hypothetical protein [Paenibacillus sp. Leaf72]KQO18044.1 hypothetical protein ASF12_05200 [Paenibacillus sp. Leaf72]
MDEKTKEDRIQYLRSKRDDPTANYRSYLINTYNYILEDSIKDNKGWSKASSRLMLNYVYKDEPDHMGLEMIDQFKKDLRELGYIKLIKIDNTWRTFIVKELDF